MNFLTKFIVILSMVYVSGAHADTERFPVLTVRDSRDKILYSEELLVSTKTLSGKAQAIDSAFLIVHFYDESQETESVIPVPIDQIRALLGDQTSSSSAILASIFARPINKTDELRNYSEFRLRRKVDAVRKDLLDKFLSDNAREKAKRRNEAIIPPAMLHMMGIASLGLLSVYISHTLESPVGLALSGTTALLFIARYLVVGLIAWYDHRTENRLRNARPEFESTPQISFFSPEISAKDFDAFSELRRAEWGQRIILPKNVAKPIAAELARLAERLQEMPDNERAKHWCNSEFSTKLALK